jgi:NADPH:quinone reductase-like Zn-dependent oxidoreductase
MKAITHSRYGPPDVLQLQELAMPVAAEGELLVRIHAASVTAADGMMRAGTPRIGRLFLGLLRPKHPVPGTGFAGEVVACGPGVRQFQTGDLVFGETVFGFGSNAQYLRVAASGVIAQLPENVSYEAAAPVCDGPLTGMNFLHNLAGIQARQRVLINGASGSLGSAAVQIARLAGAHVTAVCSAGNAAMVRDLGADCVIDYMREDFTASAQRWDIIYDTVGKSSFSRCKPVLSARGQYLSPVLGLALLWQMLWSARSRGKKAKFSATGMLPAKELRRLLALLRGMYADGALRSVIDRRYDLSGAAEAHRYIATGRKRGNVVLCISHEETETGGSTAA